MSAPVNPAEPPMAEPGKRPSGGDVGGVRAAPDAGLADDIQRSSERAGQGASTPAPPRRATQGTGSGTAADRAKRNDEDEDEWRHPPVAPVDENNPLRSLGKAVSDAVTGSEGEAARPKR